MTLQPTPSAFPSTSLAHMDTGEGNYRNWELWESLAFHTIVPSRLDWTGLLADVDQTENSRKKAHGDAGSTLPHIQGAHRFL